jgi:hypothetical protein
VSEAQPDAEHLPIVPVVELGPRYGGVNGGLLVSSVTSPVEHAIREAFDQFDSCYLPGRDNWLMRQRTGRLCEDVIRHVEYYWPKDTPA